jgi:hypothetical protein
VSQQYPMLTYPGDLLRDGQDPTGGLLGWDELYHPYEIAEVAVHPGQGVCEQCPREQVHSHVHLQHATADTMREHGEAFREAMTARGLL